MPTGFELVKCIGFITIAIIQVYRDKVLDCIAVVEIKMRINVF